MLDFIIRKGTIIDGSGSEPFEANVGISGDRIAYIGKNGVPANDIIDASGLVITPGFIDTHAHSEFTILADGRAEGKLSQGITTEINGNCGLSAAPLYGEAFERRETDLRELGITERWSDLGEYLGILKSRGIAINFSTLCGHGNLRASIIGYRDVKPDSNAMDMMKRLLSSSIREGARGLSTGLIYPPGIYSDTEELIELCSSLTTYQKSPVYTTHMRSEGDELFEAIEEVIRIGRESRIKVHISHIKTAGQLNWWKADKAIELIDKARKDGVNLTSDRYPYIAASTDLDTILPSWVHDGGLDAELRRLKDPATAMRIKEEIREKKDEYWKGVYISSVSREENKWMEGNNLYNIAMKIGKKPADALLKITIEEKARAGAIFFSMNEDNLKKFLLLPYVMIGSDSSARCFSGATCSGKPHPRGFGSFPRFIGRYVRDENLIPLSEAIRKITHLPAITFGLPWRGLIKEGYFADIVIFDYRGIIDRATFAEPYRRSEGIVHVFVNGSLALRDGEFTGSLSGRVV